MPKLTPINRRRKDRSLIPPTGYTISIGAAVVRKANLLNPDGSGAECKVKAEEGKIVIERKIEE